MQVYFTEQDKSSSGKKQTGEFVSEWLLKASSLVSMWLLTMFKLLEYFIGKYSGCSCKRSFKQLFLFGHFF
jgi:hypothetical protein